MTALLAVAVSALVYTFDPSGTSWMPKCPLHALTGLDCPSCGSMRVLHHLLHGQVLLGLSFNPMAPVLWALAAAIIVVCLMRPRRQSSSAVRFLVGAYIIIYVVWGILRNIN